MPPTGMRASLRADTCGKGGFVPIRWTILISGSRCATWRSRIQCGPAWQQRLRNGSGQASRHIRLLSGCSPCWRWTFGQNDGRRPSWRSYLAAGESSAEVAALRQFTHTGRPLGSTAFVAGLEQSTLRLLAPRASEAAVGSPPLTLTNSQSNLSRSRRTELGPSVPDLSEASSTLRSSRSSLVFFLTDIRRCTYQNPDPSLRRIS